MKRKPVAERYPQTGQDLPRPMPLRTAGKPTVIASRPLAARGLRRRRDLLIAAGLCAACGIVVAVVAASSAGMHADARLLDALAAHRYAIVWTWSRRLDDGLVPLATLIGVGTAALAFVQRGPRGATVVAEIICFAIAMGELIKALQPVPPRLLSGPHTLDSWPSGHAVVFGALAFSLVYAVPVRARLRVAATAGFCLLLSGLSLIIIRAHMPSDVVGGWLVAAFAAAAVLAVSSGRPRAQARVNGPRPKGVPLIPNGETNDFSHT